MPERPGAAHELGKTALALATGSMTGRALLGVDVGPPVHRAVAGGQTCAIAAARVDVPSGNLLRRGFRAITKISGLSRACAGAGGKDHGQTDNCGKLT